ncbi:MAG: hypothetical protein KKD39_00390, partial [Candidatus Altiarchaeota archaeon]|nr:hypothetical protein [Candidatus Altiarchaeota archaeon]
MVQRKNVSRLYLAASLSAERLLGDTRLRDEQSFVDVFRRQVVEMLDGVRRFSKDAAAEFFDGVGHLYAVDAKTGRTL